MVNLRSVYTTMGLAAFFVASWWATSGLIDNVLAGDKQKNISRKNLGREMYRLADTNNNGVLEPQEYMVLGKNLGLVRDNEVVGINTLIDRVERTSTEKIREYLDGKK
tara:strand:- start:635 stop:958 length:324 start_codon:yes stop_codon:yes gene_type:complete